MAVKKLVITDIGIKAKTEETIFLTISIGNAQIGGSVVRWKNDPDILAKGEVVNLDLGTGSLIKGKILKITTNVLDVNDQTNGMVVNHYFYNAEPSLFPYTDRVNNDGDIFQLITEYNFR
jgi:hypothetical protein